ncbi:hypothetical protein VPHD479_0239 [Vibrio phage D479]
MGAIVSNVPGGMTPVCNDCGVHLCWDIADMDYIMEFHFWENWTCRDCSQDDPEGSRKIYLASQVHKEWLEKLLTKFKGTEYEFTIRTAIEESDRRTSERIS